MIKRGKRAKRCNAKINTIRGHDKGPDPREAPFKQKTGVLKRAFFMNVNIFIGITKIIMSRHTDHAMPTH